MPENNKVKQGTTDSIAETLEKTQAQTQGEVREGQEDSSILHDNNEGNNELPRINKQDISSTSQEEFIEDRNTKKD